MKCIGCDANIGWDGKGLWSYTCPCGSRIFYNEDTGQLALPASLILNLASENPGPLPHLDDLVGESQHTSPLKERLIAELRQKGFIWMNECEQCKKDGTLQKRLDRETYLALMEVERIIRQ